MTFAHVMIGLGLILAVGAYFLLFHDDVVEKREALAKALQVKTEAEKIAKVKALSTNPKDIEKFIIDNAKTLSDATIDILIARMEMLAADRVIRDDDLKLRIDDITIPKEYEPAVPEEVDALPPQQKTSRKRK
jgi:hypothetical protein